VLWQFQNIFLVLFIPVVRSLLLPRAITELQKHEWTKNQLQEFIFQSEHSTGPHQRSEVIFPLVTILQAESIQSTSICMTHIKLCLATRRLEKVLPHQGKFLPLFLDISSFTSQNGFLHVTAKTLRLQQHANLLYAAESHSTWISF